MPTTLLRSPVVVPGLDALALIFRPDTVRGIRKRPRTVRRRDYGLAPILALASLLLLSRHARLIRVAAPLAVSPVGAAGGSAVAPTASSPRDERLF